MITSTDNPDLALLQQTVGPDVPNPDQPTPEELAAQEQQAQEEAQAAEEELDTLLLEVFKKAEKEDEDLRYPLLSRAKRNELYFNNIQKIVYDEVAQDYRTLDDAIKEMADIAGVGDIKINNIYRAFAESLIAALSISLPSVEFTPDDVSDPDDVETAAAYSKISELISRHNTSSLLLIKALTIFFNQGIVFGYNFANSSKEYGIVTKQTGTKKTGQVNKSYNFRCSNCSELLDSSVPEDQAQIVTQELSQRPCFNCDTVAPPTPYEVVEEITEPIIDENPKSRSLYEVFGCTAVKVSLYAKKQADLGYLILRVDDNVAKFKSQYKDDADKIVASGGDTSLYERWARLPFVYGGASPSHITTARYAWIRPWYFWVLENEEKVNKLTEKYPNGVMVTVIDDRILDKTHEKLDDCWTITFDPRANYIHGEPAGNALIPLQDVENDVFNLGVQSLEYGIPETFANPKTLNFDAYSKSKSAPGMITKALPPGPDKALADGFFTLKTATLSGEYSTFASSLTAKTQFAVGAFPSIFGGSMEGKGTTTATEYTESRSRALQRLQLTWQMMSIFWGKLTFKAVRLYARNMQEDEQYSKKNKGTWVNVAISTSALNGNVGHVEPEVNSQLPQSWAQKKDFFMSLISMGIPEVGTILLHPNNTQILKQITGMPDMYIPGEFDATKQETEYYELSVAEPLSQMESSVPIDLEVDDHPVHCQVLKNILVSPVGMQLYKTAPNSYQNCILHYKSHEMAIQAKTQEASGITGPNQPVETATNTAQG